MKIKEIEKNSLFPILVLVFLSVIWGSSFILIKKSLLAFSPLQVATLRIIFAFLVLLPIAIKHLKSVFKENWKQLLVLGLISNLIPAVLFAEAQTKISSSLAGMLNSLTPVTTIIIGSLFFHFKINFPLVIGLAMGLIGSTILSLIGSEGRIGEMNFYALYIIGATILYGIAGNLIKKYVGKIDPLVLVSLTMFSVGIISLALLFSTDFTHQLVTHPKAYLSITYVFLLGSVGTAFALAIFNKIVKITNAVFASSVTYMIPVIAIIWGFIDNESLFPLHFIGMGIIIIGIFIINKFK
jgi:drug/metabolite transporter (DMT)-like permease